MRDRARFGCHDMPTAAEPEAVECVVCEGDDAECEACGGSGLMVIPHCPRRLVDQEVMGLLDLVGHAEEGNLPCGGGVGDQTAWFLQGLDRVRQEHRLIDQQEKEEK